MLSFGEASGSVLTALATSVAYSSSFWARTSALAMSATLPLDLGRPAGLRPSALSA